MEYSSKAFIIHDASGEIISVGRVPAGVKGRLEVKTDVKEHSVLEVELDADQAAMSPMDLHKKHKVNVSSKKLVRK